MMLLPNIDTETIAPMLELYEQYPDCTRVMMGLQPESVKEDYKQVLDVMEKELERGIYVGVGEVGLDFYWDTTFEKEQLDVFETQLDWAKQLHLPLSIHCRNAFERWYASLNTSRMAAYVVSCIVLRVRKKRPKSTLNWASTSVWVA